MGAPGSLLTCDKADNMLGLLQGGGDAFVEGACEKHGHGERTVGCQADVRVVVVGFRGNVLNLQGNER